MSQISAEIVAPAFLMMILLTTTSDEKHGGGMNIVSMLPVQHHHRSDAFRQRHMLISCKTLNG